MLPPMPQSISYVLVQVIFSTKNRQPFMDDAFVQEMHSYLAGILVQSGAGIVRVGGMADHVHLAFFLPKADTIPQIVERLKTASSKWAKQKNKDFAWQRGYAAFSVSPRDREAVAAYIDGQQEHHAKRDYQEELRFLLRQHGVEYDEKYVWD